MYIQHIYTYIHMYVYIYIHTCMLLLPTRLQDRWMMLGCSLGVRSQRLLRVQATNLQNDHCFARSCLKACLRCRQWGFFASGIAKLWWPVHACVAYIGVPFKILFEAPVGIETIDGQVCSLADDRVSAGNAQLKFDVYFMWYRIVTP